MITGIPNYQSPSEQSLRCVCGQRYVVLLSEGTGDVEARAREKAEMLKAAFIDARRCWFHSCTCGIVLDFSPEELMMM